MPAPPLNALALVASLKRSAWESTACLHTGHAPMFSLHTAVALCCSFASCLKHAVSRSAMRGCSCPMLDSGIRPHLQMPFLDLLRMPDASKGLDVLVRSLHWWLRL